MALTDGDVAALAQQAAVSAPLPLVVRVDPDPGDDPYRWGERYWVVRFTTEDGRSAVARLGGGDSETDAEDRLAETVRGLTGPPG